MITTWIVIKDNKIIKSFETENKQSVINSLLFLGIGDYDNIINTNTTKTFNKGKDIREFDEFFNERPLNELAQEKIIIIPEDSKIVNNQIIKKTDIEMYIDGTKNPPEKYKLETCEITIDNPEGYKLTYKTMEEQLIDNDITIEDYKQYKTNLILSSFENEFENGHFMSASLGIEVDCRRSNSKNDKQNVEGLISNMSRKSKTPINYVGYSEIKTGITKTQLETLVAEMEDHVLGLYEKKWVLQTQIENATTIDDLNNIIW